MSQDTASGGEYFGYTCPYCQAWVPHPSYHWCSGSGNTFGNPFVPYEGQSKISKDVLQEIRDELRALRQLIEERVF